MKKTQRSWNSTLRTTSKKRSKLNRIRTQVLKQLGKGDRLCERCGTEKATDGHEVLRRSAGGSIIDPENIRLLCRPCHSYITNNPAQATQEGFSVSRFKIDAGSDSQGAGWTRKDSR